MDKVSDPFERINVSSESDLSTKSELHKSFESTIVLTAKDQLIFWNALQAPVQLTKLQKELSKLILNHS